VDVSKLARGDERPHVVILGGGFGGIAAARALKRARVRVTLIDKRNHHLFQPLLYQVATAALAATDIASPIRKVLSGQKNATVFMARAQSIDAKGKVVRLVDGVVPFDYLVVAVGMTNSYFGHDEWEPFAPGLKSLEEALEIRRRVLLAYESAERAETPEARRAFLTFVVVGGGPTGVELAGALVEIAQRTMAQNFRRFDPTAARVVLIEGGERLLASFPLELSEQAFHDLRDLGVEVRLNTRAKNIDEHGVDLDDERIDAETVLWGAGVAGVPVVKSIGAPMDRAGRVIVEPDLSVPGFPNVFVIGDVAAATSKGEPVPGVAQGAIQGGVHVAKMIKRHLAGEASEAFEYTDLGSMATIGRKRAVAAIGQMRMTGFIAWLAWLFVHLMALVEFRTRIFVLMQWAWAYLTYQRSARIILDQSAPKFAEGKSAPPRSIRGELIPALVSKRPALAGPSTVSTPAASAAAVPRDSA
jgi:NADH dehydrogenase